MAAELSAPPDCLCRLGFVPSITFRDGISRRHAPIMHDAWDACLSDRPGQMARARAWSAYFHHPQSFISVRVCFHQQRTPYSLTGVCREVAERCWQEDERADCANSDAPQRCAVTTCFQHQQAVGATGLGRWDNESRRSSLSLGRPLSNSLQAAGMGAIVLSGFQQPRLSLGGRRAASRPTRTPTRCSDKAFTSRWLRIIKISNPEVSWASLQNAPDVRDGRQASPTPSTGWRGTRRYP